MNKQNIFNSIDEVYDRIKEKVDADNSKKVLMLFASNSSGKTRLSKLFRDRSDKDIDKDREKEVLYYNAFTEDLFSWNNDESILEIKKDKWIFQTIEAQGLFRQITENFQKFIGSNIVPTIDIDAGQITFDIYDGDEIIFEKVKISRGEESVFIWSTFYTILKDAIETLDESSDDPSEQSLDGYRYIVIDDPVSSMDDSRIITIALELAELVINSKEHQQKFLITTHHSLFFNVLFTAFEREKLANSHILVKSDSKFYLKRQKNDAPFAYHHSIISELEEAIKKNGKGLKKYHFNHFRALLEKTANFLGYSYWPDLLPEEKNRKAFIKTLHHYSHDKLSDIESNELLEEYKKNFIEAFKDFMREYKWGKKRQIQPRNSKKQPLSPPNE